MIRICCVFGTWQLITLMASLLYSAQERQKSSRDDVTYEDYLIVFETGGVSETFKRTLHQMAATAWSWKRIVWAYDLLTDKRRFSQRQFGRLCRTLRERVGAPPGQAAEVWVCWLTRLAEKIVFDAYPQAKIAVYEDGLISYLPLKLAPNMESKDEAANALSALQKISLKVRERWETVQPVWRFRRRYWDVDPRHLARVTGTYLLLSRLIPLPELLGKVPHHSVPDDFVREALRRGSLSLPEDVLGSGLPPNEHRATPRLLVLGQALSRSGLMERNEELRFYQEVIETVAAKGYQVLWKEHPRNNEPFFDDLQAFATAHGFDERVKPLSLPHLCPIELAAPRLNLDDCVAGTSAAWFYLHWLYNIPCYTFAEQLLPRVQGADVLMNDMVRSRIPSLDRLPPVSTGKWGKAQLS